MSGKYEKRNRIIDAVVFAVLLVAVSAVTLTLFYRQTTGNPSLYHSDMKAYILEMQGLESGYSFPYPVFFKIAALINLFAASPEWAVAITTMLLNSLGILVTKLAFNHLLLTGGGNGSGAGRKAGFFEGSAEKGWLGGVLLSFAAVSLFFISMLYPPDGIYLPGIHFKYLGVFTANPFHNATYMAARPFAILAFLWFVKLLPVYEKGLEKKSADGAKTGVGLKDYIFFSVSLLLATMTKPSFTLIMVSTAGLIMLYRMIRTGFRNFVATIQLGLCFVPTFLNLLYQYSGVFVPDEGAEGGVGFCYGEIWDQYCSNYPLAICLAVGAPILILIFNFKKCRKNTMFLFSWQLYLVSFAEAFLLYEKGFRKYDFNFSWGYMCGIFFCHFGALMTLMEVTVEKAAALKVQANREAKRSLTTNQKRDILFLVLQWGAYLCHLICGLFYFCVFMSGAMYY